MRRPLQWSKQTVVGGHTVEAPTGRTGRIDGERLPRESQWAS